MAKFLVKAAADAKEWTWRQTRSTEDKDRKPDVRPTHLYVLVHGFNSCADHMKYMAEELSRCLGPKASVHLSRCNQSKIPNILVHPTHDGIDCGGERLAAEIRDVVARPEHCELKHISFLGNSMGGLFLRFAFGLLFDPETGDLAQRLRNLET